MKLMYSFNKKSNLIDIYRDNHGKWFVKVNGVYTQKKLTASEIVGYLCNAAEG